MDINTLRGLSTLFILLAFIGLVKPTEFAMRQTAACSHKRTLWSVRILSEIRPGGRSKPR